MDVSDRGTGAEDCLDGKRESAGECELVVRDRELVAEDSAVSTKGSA
jgi:hypothetical protein